jgi:phosphoribosylglycinamide formyltransferase-1
VISNNEDSGVFARAEKAGVPFQVFSKYEFEEASSVLAYLRSKNVDFIVLAGFMLKISDAIISQYPNKIINIHPSLLPSYGGKGMYGNHVHEAVINNQEKQSGITIHLVNENYDDGEIIFQAKCDISPQMGSKQLAAKVQQLEHQHFPKVVEEFIEKN